jgi:3-hydroxybutyryl-CoA dehydratase
MQVGDIRTWERTFTAKDARLFEQVSKDHGIQYILPDEQGRIMVHGLLTATLPSKISGELNYVAREMALDFVRPVYIGDTISCKILITNVQDNEHGTHISADLSCYNQNDEIVLTGHTTGVLRDYKSMVVGLN